MITVSGKDYPAGSHIPSHTKFFRRTDNLNPLSTLITQIGSFLDNSPEHGIKYQLQMRGKNTILLTEMQCNGQMTSKVFIAKIRELVAAMPPIEGKPITVCVAIRG